MLKKQTQKFWLQYWAHNIWSYVNNRPRQLCEIDDIVTTNDNDVSLIVKQQLVNDMCAMVNSINSIISFEKYGKNHTVNGKIKIKFTFYTLELPVFFVCVYTVLIYHNLILWKVDCHTRILHFRLQYVRWRVQKKSANYMDNETLWEITRSRNFSDQQTIETEKMVARSPEQCVQSSDHFWERKLCHFKIYW